MCAMNIKCRIVRGTTALCSGHTFVSNIQSSAIMELDNIINNTSIGIMKLMIQWKILRIWALATSNCYLIWCHTVIAILDTSLLALPHLLASVIVRPTILVQFRLRSDSSKVHDN